MASWAGPGVPPQWFFDFYNNPGGFGGFGGIPQSPVNRAEGDGRPFGRRRRGGHWPGPQGDAAQAALPNEGGQVGPMRRRRRVGQGINDTENSSGRPQPMASQAPAPASGVMSSAPAPGVGLERGVPSMVGEGNAFGLPPQSSGQPGRGPFAPGTTVYAPYGVNGQIVNEPHVIGSGPGSYGPPSGPPFDRNSLPPQGGSFPLPPAPSGGRGPQMSGGPAPAPGGGRPNPAMQESFFRFMQTQLGR